MSSAECASGGMVCGDSQTASDASAAGAGAGVDTVSSGSVGATSDDVTRLETELDSIEQVNTNWSVHWLLSLIDPHAGCCMKQWNISRTDWQNILSIVHDISRKSREKTVVCAFSSVFNVVLQFVNEYHTHLRAIFHFCNEINI